MWRLPLGQRRANLEAAAKHQQHSSPTQAVQPAQGISVGKISHVRLAVRDLSTSKRFYSRLLPFMGLDRVVLDTPGLFFLAGKDAGLAITALPKSSRAPEPALAAGVARELASAQHVCFRVHSRADVDALHQFLRETLRAPIVHPPRNDPRVPGRYNLLFEDPDGIKLEASFLQAAAAGPFGGAKL